MTKNENRINKLFEELVPTSGKADSLAGELVRATARIGYRFFNDGDMVNQGYGKETCNPAARFLIAKGNAEISSLTVQKTAGGLPERAAPFPVPGLSNIHRSWCE